MSIYGEGRCADLDGRPCGNIRRASARIRTGDWDRGSVAGEPLIPFSRDETPDLASIHALSQYLQARAGDIRNCFADIGKARELLHEISRITGRKVDIRFAEGRAGDQAYFVSDTRSITATLGWRATIGWRDGLKDLADWLRRNRVARRRAEQESYVA